MSAYVIIANGEFLPKSLIETLSQTKTMIALDGAANQLRLLNINPAIILGDFDSLAPETQQHWGITHVFPDLLATMQPYLGKHNVLIVPAKDQSSTDLVKAIRYCDSQHADEIAILCALGGRIDHDEGNKRVLRLEYQPRRPLTLYTATQMLRYVKDATVQIRGNIHDTVGIVGYPNAIFSSQGLTYDGNETPLLFGYDSICNSLCANTAMISIQGEALLILPLTESLDNTL